jgi:hypothetical protein
MQTCVVGTTPTHTLSQQEKVEEDRFVRAKTSEQLQKIRQDIADTTAAVQAAKDAKHYAEHIQPSINEVKALLKPNETLSDETLERIVRWNMGI